MSRLINKILNEEFEKSQNHNILKDFSKISLDYVPELLLHREEELSKLAHIFKDLVNSFNENEFDSLALLVLGDKKSGKTTTMKRFGFDLQKYVHTKCFNSKINFVYRHVNCIRYRTIYSIFISVIQSFVPEFPIRGFSTFELIKYLKEYLEVSNSYLLLTLDDVDALDSDKDYESILISLSNNENEPFIKSKKRISVILISNNKEYLKTINPLVVTQLKENIVFFNEYTENQLIDILKTRASETLHNNTWNDNDIIKIVKMVKAQNLGQIDPRLGLEILWRTARKAEQKRMVKIDLNDINQTDTLALNENRIDLNLKVQEKVVLFIVATLLLQNPNKTYVRIKEIKKEFDELKNSLNIPFKSLGYTSIFNYIQELKKLNLVVAQVTNSHKRGRTTTIRLSILPSHVDILLRNQLVK